MIRAIFTSTGQTSESEEGSKFSQFSSGHESKLAAQVVRTAGSANYAVSIESGFRDPVTSTINWGVIKEITQAMDTVPQFVDFSFGAEFRLRCKTRGTGNTLLAILG